MALGADESLASKIKIILNRVGADGDISLKKAEETIGKPVYWQIPNDTRALTESRNSGVPLLQHAPQVQVTTKHRRPGPGIVRQGRGGGAQEGEERVLFVQVVISQLVISP